MTCVSPLANDRIASGQPLLQAGGDRHLLSGLVEDSLYSPCSYTLVSSQQGRELLRVGGFQEPW